MPEHFDKVSSVEIIVTFCLTAWVNNLLGKAEQGIYAHSSIAEFKEILAPCSSLICAVKNLCNYLSLIPNIRG